MDIHTVSSFYKARCASAMGFPASMKRYLLVVILGLSLVGCGEDVPDASISDGQRESMLRALAQNVIVPGLGELTAKAATVESAVAQLVQSPSIPALDAAQTAWIALGKEWKRLEWAQQGLLDQERPDSLIFKIDLGAADHTMRNATIDQDALTSALQTSETIDVAYVERLPAALQGLYAIEDLLFAADDSSALEKLTTGPSAGKRREMLTALSTSLRQRFEMVHASWNTSGGNFQQQFINAFGTDLGSSLGMLMNDIVYLAEAMKNQKIGRPVGYLSAQVPQPDSVEARWSVQALPFFIENINGIERAFTSDADGRTGIGIDSLLNYMDAKVGDQNLSAAVITQLATMRTLAQSLGDDLPNAVRTNRTKVDQLFSECLVLLKLLKVDVVTNLGVMITTLEGDGD